MSSSTPPPDAFGDAISRRPRTPLSPALASDLHEFLERSKALREPPPDLDAWLGAERLPPFRDTLLAMIRERGLIDSRVCNAAGVDRRHYSKIRNRQDYHPTKATIFSFAFALRLGLPETRRLLRSAGYALSASSDFDLICSYFLKGGNWDADAVNDALYAYGQPLICGALE